MSVLALIFILITPLLTKRYSVSACYYAWLVVIIGLIIPLRPQWSNAIIRVDISSQTAVSSTQTESGQTSDKTTQPIPPLAIQFRDNPVRYIQPVSLPNPLSNTVLPSSSPVVSLWQFTALVWLVGVIVFLIHHGIKHYRFIKMIRRWSEQITEAQTVSTLHSLQAEMGISKPVSLYQCPNIGSPMMTGLLKPRILLPATDLTPDALRFILAHELVHYKRKDLYYKCLILLATAIHWFNPIVYLVAKTIDTQCELSCDAKVVQSADPGTRHNYSLAIINLVKYRSVLKTSLSTNFHYGRKCMKKRIFTIMDMSKKRTGIAIFLAVLLITLGTGFASLGGSILQNKGTFNASTVAGDIIRFGGNDWRVLEVKDSRALVLSDKVLSAQVYHALDVNPVTWEESNVRQYLNESFYYETFSESERARIAETVVSDRDNPWYGMSSGNESTDKVFLLSIDEVLHYFGDSGGLENRSEGISYISDEFSEERLAETMNGEAASWWLRSPGIHYNTCEDAHTCAAIITSKGSVNIQGDFLNNSGGIRPAMWLTQ